MARITISASAWISLWVCLLAISCARIDHRAELELAGQRVERATGVNPGWQEHPPVEELSIDASGVLPRDAAIRLALQNNRGLRAELELIGQAKADWMQAGLLPNPMLSVMLQFPEGGGLADLTFGLTQDLAAIWLIPSRQRSAQAALQQRIVTAADAALALVTDVRSAYATLQYQRLARELEEQNLQVLREAIEIAQTRLRGGEASELDVNLLQGRYFESDLARLQLESEYHVTQRQLLRLMGVARDRDDWQPAALRAPAPESATWADDEFVDLALGRRLDLAAADFEREAALFDLDQQRLRFVQEFGIGIGGERFERRALPDRDILADTARASLADGRLTAPEIQSRGQRRKERSQQIDLILGPTLEFALPLFDQNQAQVAKAAFRAREVQQRYAELEQRIAESVRSALVQRRLAAQRVRIIAESLLPLQESNLRLAETAYRGARETILTVLLAQEALIRTHLAHAAALRDLEISTAVVERQLAQRLEDIAPSAPATTTAPTALP